MQQFLLVFALAVLLVSCGEEGTKARRDVDQALEQVADKTRQLADSAKEKYKDVRDHVDTAYDRDRVDTAR